LELVDAWSAHDKTEALRDASPAAVAALFAYQYPADGVQFRGCSNTPAAHPSDFCVYRMGNGILSLTVTQPGGEQGWAVTGAALET
jgi:hypothetical protein